MPRVVLCPRRLVVPARRLLLVLVQVELVMAVRVLGLLVPLVLTAPRVLVLVRVLLAHLAPHVLVVPAVLAVHLVLLVARLVVQVAVVLVAALADLEVRDQVVVDVPRAVVVVVVGVVKMIYRHRRSLIAKTRLQSQRALSLLSVAYLRKSSGHV